MSKTKFDEFKDTVSVTVLKYPNSEDLKWVKTCTLNTVGKTIVNEPTEEWLYKLVKSGHSPARELIFGIKMVVPYWVSVHFVRHHIGVNHYVQTQRDDRVNRENDISRSELPQGSLVSHIMSINAEELINMSHKRLCRQASPETRYIFDLIADAVEEVAPYMVGLMQPMCVYRNGLCDEFKCCGLNKIYLDK